MKDGTKQTMTSSKGSESFTDSTQSDTLVQRQAWQTMLHYTTVN